MLTRIMKPRDDRDAGFTLIELLVVVVIIGILAAIAIPVFLNQRNSARNASVESDLRNAATVMETAYTESVDGTYPTGDLVANYDAQLSPGNNLAGAVVNNGSAYVLAGCNVESGVMYYYDSQGGGLTDVAPTGAPFTTCPAAPAATTLTVS